MLLRAALTSAGLRDDVVARARAVITSLPAFGPTSLPRAVAEDIRHRRYPSLLLAASQLCDPTLLSLLLAAGACPRDSDDLYAAAVSGADGNDARLLLALTTLHDAGIATARSATLATRCQRGGYYASAAYIANVTEVSAGEDDYATSLRIVATRDGGGATLPCIVTSHFIAAMDVASSPMDAVVMDRREDAVRRAAALATEYAELLPQVIVSRESSEWEEETGCTLFQSALEANDVSLTMALVCAYTQCGGVPSACYTGDVYASVLEAMQMSGVDTDERVAETFKKIHAAGVRLPPQETVSHAASECVAAGLLESTRLMVEVIDPCARGRTIGLETLLDVAVHNLQASVCNYLLDAGWAVGAADNDGLTPLARCVLASRPWHVSDLHDTITVLLRGRDAQQALHHSGLCAGLHESMAEQQMFVALDHKRWQVLIYLCAAARTHPVASCVAANTCRSVAYLTNGWLLMRTLPLDAHVGSPGLYLRDALRASGHAMRVAVSVDVLADVVPIRHMVTHRLAVCQVWTTHCNIEYGRSTTVCAWAWMRRLHALMACRTVALSSSPV